MISPNCQSHHVLTPTQHQQDMAIRIADYTNSSLKVHFEPSGQVLITNDANRSAALTQLRHQLQHLSSYKHPLSGRVSAVWQGRTTLIQERDQYRHALLQIQATLQHAGVTLSASSLPRTTNPITHVRELVSHLENARRAVTRLQWELCGEEMAAVTLELGIQRLNAVERMAAHFSQDEAFYRQLEEIDTVRARWKKAGTTSSRGSDAGTDVFMPASGGTAFSTPSLGAVGLRVHDS